MLPKQSFFGKFILISTIYLCWCWWCVFYSRVNCFISITICFSWSITLTSSSNSFRRLSAFFFSIYIDDNLPITCHTRFFVPDSKIIKIIISCPYSRCTAKHFITTAWYINTIWVIIRRAFNVFRIIYFSETVVHFNKRSIFLISGKRISRNISSLSHQRSSHIIDRKHCWLMVILFQYIFGNISR